MHPRPAPRPTPPADSALHFVIDVPGRGPTSWRLPFPIHLAVVVDLLNRTHDESREKLMRARDAWLIGGVAIGLCWDDAELAMGSTLREYGDDWLRYGEAVLEELHLAGWTMAQVGDLYPQLLTRIRDALDVAGSEAKARADFSAAQQDKAP